MKALDVEAVAAFVLVADLRSFTRAAEAMATTQSAVSLKLKRLEDGLGQRLLERTPRLVRLSAAGSAFLGPARALVAAHEGALAAFAVAPPRLAVGISDHLVGAPLPLLLRHMHAAEPALRLEVRVAPSRDVLEVYEAGGLDAAIVLREDRRRRDGEVILAEPFGWMGTPQFDRAPGAALRLATQAHPCSVRETAIAALDAAGIPWTEVFVGGGIATIGAAVAAGLAVAALARRVAPPGVVDVGLKLGLPVLPARDVVLYAAPADPRTRARLRTLMAALRGM